MKTKPILVSYTTDLTMLVMITPASFMQLSMGYDRDAARALIGDQLAVFKHLWPDAPQPTGDTPSPGLILPSPRVLP